jgi:uncharacterized LabA/DUF88 family protein
MTMTVRTRVFVDYWNFQLNWNERARETRCDWLALPRSLAQAASKVLDNGSLSYDGTHIYASVDPCNDNLIAWLSTFLDRQPGFAVTTVPMTRRHRPIRCTSCGHAVTSCPECDESYAPAAAKGLSTRMVVDLLRLCGRGSCEVPIVVSSDTELVPALEALNADGVKVLHAGWRDTAPDLARAAWASVELDDLMGDLVRT